MLTRRVRRCRAVPADDAACCVVIVEVSGAELLWAVIEDQAAAARLRLGGALLCSDEPVEEGQVFGAVHEITHEFARSSIQAPTLHSTAMGQLTLRLRR